eukprot:CAMPEP_0119413840 /NCGR_PEP_ID=MMETSP1335-20130426/6112_1 /TAXON_ID=259385 /ORGANISM="Chrysoculter rhomboideus, Strain RCC1486" /LENGTH=140 /DNA_ID=CAMNT_0007438669 /DNA_START=87 /DNA_END=509 /DNA_ORIENTATION=-
MASSTPELPPAVLEKVDELFKKMDFDKDGKVDLSEAEKFWSSGKLGKFGKMSARAMFNEVDDDENKAITHAEWVEFWANVRNNSENKYSDEEIVDELKAMIEGEAWRDWDDGRSTTHHTAGAAGTDATAGAAGAAGGGDK